MIITKAHLFISGRVQGVSFRHYAMLVAKELRLNGWVYNRDDGRVEIMAEGNEEAVQQFITWCHKGPPSSKVTDFSSSITSGEQEYYSFETIYHIKDLTFTS